MRNFPYHYPLRELQVLKLFDDAILPTRGREFDAGLDLYALEDQFIEIQTTAKVKTGIAINVPPNYVGKIEDRSGLASKGLRTGGGVVDHGYNGDVTVVLHNLTNDDIVRNSTTNGRFAHGYEIKKGDRIAQLLLYPIETPVVQQVHELWTSERSAKGFGSSGN